MAENTNEERFIVNHLHSEAVNDVTKEPMAPDAKELGVSEMALNLAKGVETLYVKNEKGEIIATPLGTRGYDALRKQLEEIAQIYSIYGMARVNGESDPKGTIFFGERANFQQIANVTHFGYFDQQGKLYKRCANGRVDLATDGTKLFIDGSDGDLLFYIDRTVYVCRFTDIVEGKELNVMAIGLAPFTIYGHNAKKFQPFAIDPCAPTYTQLTTENNGILASCGEDREKHYADFRRCTHSIYNPNVKSYRVDNGNDQYSAAPAIFTKPWRAGSEGYPSTYSNCVNSIYRAQEKNELATTNRPYMGMYYEFYEFWMMLMFLELNSLNHTGLAMFGTGTSVMDPANSYEKYGDLDAQGNTGWMRVKTVAPTEEGGETTYTRAAAALHSSQNVNGTSYYGTQTLVGTDYYCFTECLEPQRILSDIAKAGLISKIWTTETGNDENKGVIFTHDAEGNMIVAEGIVSTDFQTGANTNIVANQRYYQVRNVPGCAGMKDGVMTAVINEFVKMELSTDNKSVYDYIIYKLSYPVYRGMSVLNNFRNHVQGCHYRKWREAPGATVQADFIYAKNVDDVPAVPRVNYYGDGISTKTSAPDAIALEDGLAGVGKSMNTNGYVSKSDYNASLFAATAVGATIRTHECAYTWASGNPSECKYLYPVVVGESALNVGFASARNVGGYNAVSRSRDGWAPRFALPHPQL